MDYLIKGLDGVVQVYDALEDDEPVYEVSMDTERDPFEIVKGVLDGLGYNVHVDA